MEFLHGTSCPTGKSLLPCWPLSIPGRKNISLCPSGKSSLEARAVPPETKGALRGRHETLGGMRWTRACRQDERHALRTAKACGPGFSMLKLSWRWCGDVGPSGPTRRHHADDGDNKARSPGRARHRPLKPFACGNAGMSRRTRGVELVCFLLFAREAAGASRARHSPRPLWAEGSGINPGADASREGEGVFAGRSPSFRTLSIVIPERCEASSYGAQLRTGESIRPRECLERWIPGLVLRTIPE